MMRSAKPQLSVATGAPRSTLLAVQPLVEVAVTAGGQFNWGVMLSITVTDCVQVDVFPLASVAVQSTCVTPRGNVPGASFAKVTVPQSALARGFANTSPVASQAVVVYTVTSAGQLSVGRIVSTTVMVNEQEASFPKSSVAVMWTDVFPGEKEFPDAWSEFSRAMITVPGQLSVAVGIV